MGYFLSGLKVAFSKNLLMLSSENSVSPCERLMSPYISEPRRPVIKKDNERRAVRVFEHMLSGKN